LFLRKVRGVEQGDTGVDAKFASEERNACVSLALSRGSITARHVCPDQEFLRVFIERVRGDEPTGEFNRSGTVAHRELGSGRLPENALGRAGQVSPAREQPCLECGTRRKGLALQ
jgi:hypothetical protein